MKRFPLILAMLLIPVCAWSAEVYVLVYHSFFGNASYPGDVSLRELEDQIEELRRLGFSFVSSDDLDKAEGRQNILITIDDGNRSTYRAWQEVLKPQGIRPLLAINPGGIGHSANTLSWRQLEELAREGCTIASHGHDHIPLSQKLYQNDRATFLHEIVASKAMLEQKLAQPVTIYAYPNGVRTAAAFTELAKAGYRYAFTINWGPVQIPLNDNPNPYALPRYMIYSGNWEMLSASIRRTALAKKP